MSSEPPPREISRVRVGILLCVVAALAIGGWRVLVVENPASAAVGHRSPVYAPYVDVTLTPTYAFQSTAANPVSSTYLAFLVSDPHSACTPSWGGYYTVSQADSTLNLGSRIAQVRAQGGRVALSYGGRSNTDLAVACTSMSQLVEAYRSPLKHYHASTIDLDVEGAALDDTAANRRRAEAVAAVQRTMPKLKVWLTLPVSTSGLTTEGLAAVRSMLAAHVRLTGVNVMAMDFGQGAGTHMGTRVTDSLRAAHGQVRQLWRRAGLSGSSASAWEHLGVTVMIGVNDDKERFTTADARRLKTFADRQGLPRVSIWSLNRDAECGGAFPATGVVSNTCSGVRQSTLGFTKILSKLPGTTTARTSSESGSGPSADGSPTTTDHPATSPYPIWRSSAPYVAGYKVVWQGAIYQAQWWTQGTPPDAGSSAASPSPWLLIGPVTSHTRAASRVLLPAGKGTFATWSAGSVYQQGDRVTYAGLPYRARYYTKGDQPSSDLPADQGSPWTPLFTYVGEPTDTSSGS